jgi:dTDP-4-dehydrorhamnose reductase
MQVLVTGAGGQVGQELRRAPWPPDTMLIAMDRQEFDIADHRQVAARIAKPLGLVINAAAYTAVDRAETDREGATRVNAHGPALLAEHCAELGIPLIHLSTDYIFDGLKRLPYLEDDDPAPINHYGASKLEGEIAVRASLREHLILRTASVVSEFGTNFVKTMLRLGAERSRLEIVGDQWSCPTAASDIAAAIVRIALRALDRSEQDVWGTFNFCGKPPVTWFEFAKEIFRAGARHGGRTPQLNQISAMEYVSAAARPSYSAMNCDKIARLFGIEAPPWKERLPPMVAAILERSSPR